MYLLLALMSSQNNARAREVVCFIWCVSLAPLCLTLGKDNTKVWIGGTLDFIQWRWRWRWDGLYTGIVEAFDWYPGEPSGSEYCLEGFDNNQWNDEDCWSLRPYICERA